MQFQLRSVVSHPRASTKSVTEHVFSSQYPRLVTAAHDLLIDHSTPTNAINTIVHTPSKVDKLEYVANPPVVLAFLDDGQVAVYHESSTGLTLASSHAITTDSRPVSLTHGAQFGNFAVFCKADSPSVWCLPVSSPPSAPFKLRSDLGGDQQNASIIDGTLARLRNKVSTKAKSRPSAVIALTSHSTMPLVAAAYRNGIIRVWDIERRDQRTHLDAQLLMAEHIVEILFHPKFHVLVACTNLGRIISFLISATVYKHGDEPALPTSKTRDRKRRFRAMCFTHSDPSNLILLTATKRLIVRNISRRGLILASPRFPRASRPLNVQDGAILEYQHPSSLANDEFEQENPVSMKDGFPASIKADPIFGLIACSLDKSGSIYMFQPSIDKLPVLFTPLSPSLDLQLSASASDEFLGEVDVDTESLFVHRNTLFSYSLGSERINKLCRLPAGDVQSIDIARDSNGYSVAALVFYHGEDMSEANDFAETEESTRYVLCTRRGENDYWNVSEPVEGRSGCFLNRPGKHDRILIVSSAGTTVSIASFMSSASPSSGAARRGVQRFKLPSGRSGRVFRAPFAGWTAVTYHDIRGKRVAISKNTFGSSGNNSPEEVMSSYSMDDSTALQLHDNETVVDVRWQQITKYSKRDDDFLGVILTDKRIYIVHHVLQLLCTFDFQTVSRMIVPFALPSISWNGPSVMLLYGNSLISVSIDGTYDVIAGLSHSECASSIVACLADRVVYATPSFGGKIGAVCVRSRPYSALSPASCGILALLNNKRSNVNDSNAIVKRVFENHDVSQGSFTLANTLKSKGLSAIAYVMTVSKQGKHSLSPIKRALFLCHMGDIRGALAVAENEYTKLENANLFHHGTELYRLFQRILNVSLIIGDFEVARRCSQLIGRRGTLSSFIEAEGGYDALRAVIDVVRRKAGNPVIMNKLRLIYERSANSSVATLSSVIPSTQDVQALRQAIASGIVNQASFGSSDKRPMFIKVVTPQEGNSGKLTAPIVNRIALEHHLPQSVTERLEILRDESVSFEADIESSSAAHEYAEFVEDGPRVAAQIPMINAVDESSATAAGGTGISAQQNVVDSSDDEGDDQFVSNARQQTKPDNDLEKPDFEGLLPVGQGQLSQATMKGAVDTEAKLEQQRIESHAFVQQATQSMKDLAIAQKQIQPSELDPTGKARDLIERASEKLRENKIKPALHHINQGIRLVERCITQRSYTLNNAIVVQLVQYRFACKLNAAMDEIADSEHASSVPGRLTYVQLASTCSNLTSLLPADRVNALVKTVDVYLTLSNFGLAAQAMKLIKQLGVPEGEGNREELRKRYAACQARGFSDSTPIPRRITCFSSLRAIVPGTPMLGCPVCGAVYGIDAGIKLGTSCEYCRLGRIIMR